MAYHHGWLMKSPVPDTRSISRSASVSRAKSRLVAVRYGWWVALAGGLAMAITSGPIQQGSSALFAAVEDEFGWSRALVAGAASLGQLVRGLFGPLQGLLVDRVGPAKMVIVGLSTTGIASVLLSQIHGPVGYYVAFVFMFAGIGLGAFMPSMTAVNAWLPHRRSSGMAFVVGGSSAGAILVPVMAWSITAFGWRPTMVGVGITLLLAAPAIAKVMARRPPRQAGDERAAATASPRIDRSPSTDRSVGTGGLAGAEARSGAQPPAGISRSAGADATSHECRSPGAEPAGDADQSGPRNRSAAEGGNAAGGRPAGPDRAGGFDGPTKPRRSTAERAPRSPFSVSEYTAREALRTWTFWAMATTHTLVNLSVAAVFAHVILHFRDVGMSIGTASTVVPIMGAAAFAAQMSGGYLGDRLPKRLVVSALMFIQAGSVALLAFVTSYWMAVIFAVFWGIGFGGRGPIFHALRGDYFGRKSFGTILGISSLPLSMGMMAAPVAVGWAFDQQETYRWAFLGLSAAATVGALLVLTAKRPRPKRVGS